MSTIEGKETQGAGIELDDTILSVLRDYALLTVKDDNGSLMVTEPPGGLFVRTETLKGIRLMGIQKDQSVEGSTLEVLEKALGPAKLDSLNLSILKRPWWQSIWFLLRDTFW